MTNSKIDIRDAFFEEVYKLGKRDKNLIFITDDMDAFVLRRFRRNFPKQFINIGVAEQNLMNVAAGLAASHKKVFVYGIANYVTMRCFEQIKFSICSMNLPVVIVAVGPGFSFAFDGPTHHGTNDLAIMRTLPEITIYNPSDAASAAACAVLSYNFNGPVYVRLDKGVFPNFWRKKDNFSKGFKILKNLSKTNIVSNGYMTQQAIKVSKNLEKKSLQFGVIDIFRIKPVALDFYKEVVSNSEKIVTLEENCLTGGIGSLVSELISDYGANVKLKRIALPDLQLFTYGSRDYLHKSSSIDLESIEKALLN